MNGIRKHLRRSACFLLCLFLLTALLPVSVMSAEADTDTKVVRAGWYEDAYNITGENGERSGYGYEYEQSVAAYTGWSYEYVRNGWADLLEMMEKGEIDIMGGISYTEERAQKMLFSELPMGTEKYYLYADLEHTDISPSDLTTLNGKRVALMPTSVQATQFYEWEQAHDLHMEYVDVNSFEEGKRMAENDEIDCVISTETPDWVEFGMSAIAVTGGSDIYFAINKNRPDLKAELDTAMRKMEQDKPFYADELYKRYLSAVSTPVLSNEEKIWLNQHGTLRIGFLKEDPGISMLDGETNQLSGVITDYVSLAKDSLGNQKLTFTLVGFDSLADEIQALKDGEIDFIFHFTQNPYIAEENGFVLSNTVLAFNMAAVTTQNYFNETSANRVAILKDEQLVKWYISYYYPDWKIIECNTEADVERMVLNGQADCLVAESGQLEQYSQNKRFHNVFLTQAGNTAFAVNRGESTLMSILNKTLLTIPSSMLTGALFTYDSNLRKVTLADFIRENILVFASVSITVFLLILLLILSFLRKSKKAEAAAREAARQSQELNQKLQQSQHELQTALQAAETASRAKTDFLSSISHDIRTPMNAIIGLTTLMKNEEGLSDRMREYLDKLESSGHHLLELINNVLDMNRIESGQTTLQLTSINLAEQVAQVDDLIRPQTNQKNQTLTIVTTHLNHEYVMADPTRLQQVLVNILSNSVKYTPIGGRILFELEEMPRNGHYARYKFIVQDNGIGMSQEFLQHIFDPFARAENSVTNKVQGTGLGMAITKSVVDLMGGVIHVDSTPGQGSRFEVTLELPIDTEADQNVQHLSVLLVGCDKDADFQRIQDAVEDKPIHLHRTRTTAEGFTALRQATFDVVLLPLATPEKDVLRLRALAGVDTVLLGEAGPETAEPEPRAGQDGVLPYPFFLSNLEAEVRRVQEARKAANQPEDVSPLRGMKFLCAEDNEINAEILRLLLESKGASCTIYPNGQEIVDAFAAVRPGDYDMILMDVQMPVMNGLEAARRIRSSANPLGKTIPILAMTANAFLEDIQKSREAGMDEHLSKPVDIKVLEQTVRRLRTSQK